MKFKNTQIVLVLIALCACLPVLISVSMVQAESCPTGPLQGGSVGPWKGSAYTYYLQGMDSLVRVGTQNAFET
jgi:hypothetical protein